MKNESYIIMSTGPSVTKAGRPRYGSIEGNWTDQLRLSIESLVLNYLKMVFSSQSSH